MVSQFNLLREYCDYNSDKVYKTKEETLDLREKCLFSVDESDYVYITLTFNQEQYNVFIDSFEDENEIELISGKRYRLSSGREDLGCYFPGYFNITIVSSSGEKGEFLFFVKPKNTDLKSILEIRKYVNDFYFGLSNDFKRKAKTNGKELVSNHVPNITEKYFFLVDKFSKILNIFERYVRNGKDRLVKEKKVSSKITKVSNSSVKWLSTKGMSKNFNIYSPDKILEKKVIASINTSDNRIMKSELLFWKMELSEVIQSVDSYLSNVRKQIIEKNDYIIKLEDTVKNQENNKFINEQVKKRDIKRLEQYKNDKNEDEILYERYDLNNIKLKKYYQIVDHLIYDTWFINIVPDKVVGSYISDQQVRQEILLKNEYLGSSVNRTNNTLGFGEKCTPKLFETYIYVLLINMLSENGYKLVSHNSKKDNLVPVLSNQGNVILYDGEKYCEILYDYELKKSNDNNLDNEFVTINSIHNRPDFIVSFYKSKEKIEKAIVVEVKWRPNSAVFNEDGDTSVVTNLKDYFSLGYHVTSVKPKTNRGVIDKALVVYPDLNERVINIQDEELIAIGLKPSADIINTEGYRRLSEYITG